MNAPTQTSVAEMRQGPSANALVQQNHAADLMTVQGFALMQRVAQAFITSTAVPPAFRSFSEKKSNGEVILVENPAAMGNCLVAIEQAKALGMPVSSVMQNADVIENRLRWSGKFVIASINASGRFTQLRYRLTKKGRISAKYTEKQGWNKQKGGFDFVERSVEIDDIECVAWAYAIVNGVADTSEKIESPKVSIKMAVEQGWYSKPGSKWQGEMQDLMLHYRAGTFFGNVHAPDLTMGMGRTSEEEYDILDVEPDGSVSQVTRGRGAPTAKRADVVEAAPAPPAPSAPEPAPPASAPASGLAPAPPAPAADPQQDELLPPGFDADAFAQRLETCRDLEALHVLADEIRGTPDDVQARLYAIYRRRERDLNVTPTPAGSDTAPPPTAARARTRSSIE